MRLEGVDCQQNKRLVFDVEPSATVMGVAWYNSSQVCSPRYLHMLYVSFQRHLTSTHPTLLNIKKICLTSKTCHRLASLRSKSSSTNMDANFLQSHFTLFSRRQFAPCYSTLFLLTENKEKEDGYCRRIYLLVFITLFFSSQNTQVEVRKFSNY